MTLEYTNDLFRADLNKLQGYIAERIAEKNYGASVVKYFWGFELFKFDGEFSQFYRNEIESWKYSLKWLVTNSNFDWDKIYELNELQTYELIKKEILASIGRISQMKRKPKDFDYEGFIRDLDKIITEYIANKVWQN